jgi:SecD/SecF fusion protein
VSKTARWRALLVVAVTVGALAVTATRPVRLGLDLRGGTQIVLEARDTDQVKVDDDVAVRTLEVLRRRVDALGVAEPALQRSGDRRIIVELPGVADPTEALRVIGSTAQLTFHPVVAAEPPAPATATPAPPPPGAPDGERVLDDGSGTRLRVSPPTLTGEAVAGADAVLDPASARWTVQIDFRDDGARHWAALTGDAACSAAGAPARRVAIVLDDKVISSPQVDPSVRCGEGISGGQTVITGQFSEDEAKDLALLVRAGALPVPVDVVEQRTVGPTLGERPSPPA